MEAIDIIKKFEGFRPLPYLDTGGIPTIGYGTVFYPDMTKVTMDDHKISEEYASSILEEKLKDLIIFLPKHVSVSINKNQANALYSLIYNIGKGAFQESTLLIKLNASDYIGAADQFLVWKYVNHHECQGLLSRRIVERELFITKVV